MPCMWLAPCRCLDGHVKEPYEMSMAYEPDRRSNFFFSPHAHLCAVIYIIETSLHVTLSNQSHPFTHSKFSIFFGKRSVCKVASTDFIEHLSVLVLDMVGLEGFIQHLSPQLLQEYHNS